jgi:opacity protein-like surface antigen
MSINFSQFKQDMELAANRLFSGACFENFQYMGQEQQQTVAAKVVAVALASAVLAAAVTAPFSGLAAVVIVPAVAFVAGTASFAYLTRKNPNPALEGFQKGVDLADKAGNWLGFGNIGTQVKKSVIGEIQSQEQQASQSTRAKV